MTKNLLIYVLLLFSFTFSGCSKTLNLYVYGEPNTQILNPQGETCATLNSIGEAKVKIPRKNTWYPYMVSYHPTDGSMIPFAIDYKQSSKGLVPKWIAATIALAPSFGQSGYGMSMYDDFNDVYGQYTLNKSQYTNQTLDFEPIAYNTLQTKPNNESFKVEESKVKNGKRTKGHKDNNNNVFIHIVKNGETIQQIAEQYEVKPRQIIRWNKLPNSTLRTGQKLKINIDE